MELSPEVYAIYPALVEEIQKLDERLPRYNWGSLNNISHISQRDLAEKASYLLVWNMTHHNGSPIVFYRGNIQNHKNFLCYELTTTVEQARLFVCELYYQFIHLVNKSEIDANEYSGIVSILNYLMLVLDKNDFSNSLLAVETKRIQLFQYDIKKLRVSQTV